MSERPPDEALAKLILQGGLTTGGQIRKALAEAAAEHVPLGDILIRKGLITPAQRENIEKKLETQKQKSHQLGPYKIIRKLGEGGMGTVYLAEHETTGEKVALKVLPKVASKDQSAVARFLREVESARKLQHPNIVRAGESGEDRGYHYYVMEYVEGETLGKRLKREEALYPVEATKIVLQVARGLRYAHNLGFIHRDIKPDNVIVTPDGTARILDMGLSKNIEEAQTVLTAAGVTVGTPHYIAPEQATGEKNIDGRADIYSLGAMYYHMVTGETPFHGTTAIEVISQHINRQIPDPQDIRDGIPSGVVHIIRRMMAKTPGDRFRDCLALITDLELVHGGGNPSSQPLDPVRSAVAFPMGPEARSRYRAQLRRRPPTTRRSTVKPPPVERSRIPLIVGGACVAIIAVVLPILLVAGERGGGNDRPKPAPLSPTAEAPGEGNPEPDIIDPLEKARDYRRKHPDDLIGQISQYEKALWKLPPSRIGECQAELNVIKAALQKKLDVELAQLEVKIDAPVKAKNYDKALKILKEAAGRHKTPLWRLAVDKKIARILDLRAKK